MRVDGAQAGRREERREPLEAAQWELDRLIAPCRSGVHGYSRVPEQAERLHRSCKTPDVGGDGPVRSRNAHHLGQCERRVAKLVQEERRDHAVEVCRTEREHGSVRHNGGRSAVEAVRAAVIEVGCRRVYSNQQRRRRCLRDCGRERPRARADVEPAPACGQVEPSEELLGGAAAPATDAPLVRVEAASLLVRRQPPSLTTRCCLSPLLPNGMPRSR